MGAFSYGIYLVHQPYVIWLGLRIQEQPVWVFFGLSGIVLVVLSAWGLGLEKFANAMLEKVIGGKRSPREEDSPAAPGKQAARSLSPLGIPGELRRDAEPRRTVGDGRLA